ncbi:MAG: LuxR C-terminal-related transcriptional regulator [Cupriavidus necator]
MSTYLDSAASSSLPSVKLSPPAADARHVLRELAIESILQSGAVRLVLLEAPAGFGKSTLMAQARRRLIEQSIATAWLNVDAADNDIARFVTSIHAALDQLEPEPEDSEHSTYAVSQSENVVDRLSTIDFPFVVFIDEFETIRSEAVLSLIEQLVDRLPRGGKFVIGTRVTQCLRLGRLRATGQLRELDTRDLRFTLDETRRFFSQRSQQALSDLDLSLLHAKTEGWAAALWLTALTLERNARQRDVILNFSGPETGLAAYLAEEVLAKQPKEWQVFLLRTSILTEVSVDLCQALVPDADSSSMLNELSAAHVFLAPVEGQSGTWRYHSLFADFLRSELQRVAGGELPRLHKAAADAYRIQGRQVRAIEHLLLGGQFEEATVLMQEHATSLLTKGRFGLLTRWFDLLPAAALNDSPLLQVIKAWAIDYTRGPRAAKAQLDSLGPEVAEDAEAGAHLAALRVTLLNQMDRWEEAYAAGRKALTALPSPSPFADTSLVTVVASAATVLGLFDESRRMLDRARQRLPMERSSFHRMYAECVEGITDLLGGRLRQAQARFRLALQTSQAASDRALHGNAWAGMLYAVSVYECGDIEHARQLLLVYLPLAQEAWLSDHTILGYLLLSRIEFRRGNVDQALDSLLRLEYLGQERALPRFEVAARLERARILLRQGHCAAAQDELVRAAESPALHGISMRRHLAHDWDDLQIGQAQWELSCGDRKKARAQLEGLLNNTRSHGLERRRLKLDLLLAMASFLEGDKDGAVAACIPVLRAGFTEGAASVFVDEGAIALCLVREVLAATPAHVDPMFADYLQTLMASFGSLVQSEALYFMQDQATAGPAEALTPKEIQLLGLVAEGYSNKALAEKLSVSVNTISTHLYNINAKLATRSRTQAVALGRRYGLIK